MSRSLKATRALLLAGAHKNTTASKSHFGNAKKIIFQAAG
jgi:hypothetical protein